MNTTILVLTIINSLLTVVPIVLHGIGIHLLRNSTSQVIFQKHYLMHMSVVEVVFAFIQLLLIIWKVIIKDWFRYASMVSLAIGFIWSNILIMLTIDRFLQVHLNIRYSLVVTKRKTKFILLSCYILGVLITVIAIILDPDEKIRILRAYCHTFYAALMVVCFIATYSYIYWRMKMNRTSHRVQSTNHPINQRVSRASFAPFWILLTYFFLILVPNGFNTIMISILGMNLNEDLLYQIVSLLWTLDFAIDALIYILLNEALKPNFFRMFGKSSNVYLDTRTSIGVPSTINNNTAC